MEHCNDLLASSPFIKTLCLIVLLIYNPSYFLASENNQGTGQQNVWTLIVKRQCFIPGLGFAAPAAMHSGERQ